MRKHTPASVHPHPHTHTRTRTHTEICNTYCFPRQQWFRECASLLRYTYEYIACLVLPNFCQNLCFHVRLDGVFSARYPQEGGILRRLILSMVLFAVSIYYGVDIAVHGLSALGTAKSIFTLCNDLVCRLHAFPPGLSISAYISAFTGKFI
jgi:hypothetical protein